jgi:hypothetical protein
MKHLDLIYILRSLSINYDVSVDYDPVPCQINRAYFKREGLKEFLSRTGLTSKTKDIAQLVVATRFTNYEHEDKRGVWILFDTVNGNYDDPENGDAHIFIFASRHAAREHKRELDRRRQTKPNTITVSGPHRYYYAQKEIP